jgi:acetyltransferase
MAVEILLPQAQARRLLLDYEIPLAIENIAAGPAAASRAAAEIGFPVALKAIDPHHSHKTDAGLVQLNLRSINQVLGAARTMQNRLGARPSGGFQVQEMVSGGVEMIAGVHNDPQFGPVVLAGAGGVLVELVDDAVLGLPPLNARLALEMLQQSKAWKLLQGFRGRPAADITGLISLLVNLSRLALDQRERLASLDLNPVIVLPEGQGVRVVDYRVSVWDSPPVG